ncbi:MAG: MEKHLA domain-containing protein [Reinekea sp.]
MSKPDPENNYLAEHAELLISSYHRLTGKDLVNNELTGIKKYKALYEGTFGLLSHNTEDDPIFNYGNRTALDLFQMDWQEFTQLPSRKSAEPVNRAERQQLLDRVTSDGFIDDYCGIRISSTGNRFWIENATVWNLINDKSVYCGQAAVFHRWTIL